MYHSINLFQLTGFRYQRWDPDSLVLDPYDQSFKLNSLFTTFYPVGHPMTTFLFKSGVKVLFH